MKTVIKGNFLGMGSFGRVITNPRAPFNNELINDLQLLNEASKIFIYEDDYSNELNFYKSNKWILNFDNYLVIPIKLGLIDKSEVLKYSIKYYNRFYCFNLSAFFANDDKIYQITFPIGKNISDTTKTNLKFVFGLKNIFDCLSKLKKLEYFYPDLKMGNIVDMYNYNELVKPELDYNSLYKLIDYTSILSTNYKCIDDSINELFFRNNQMFEFGIEYTSYPLIPILALRYLIGNIDINLTETIIDEDSETVQLDEDSETVQLDEDSLSKYLLNTISSLHFKYNDYNIKILTLPKKISSFKFTIKLFNTKSQKVVDYNINNNNINEFMNQIYFEKNGYINKNELHWKIKIKMLNLDEKENFVKNINIFRKKTISNYVNIFKIYLKTFINFNEKISKCEQIKLILESVQNYSLGIIILNYINNLNSNNESDDDLYYNLLKIALMCCVIIFYDRESDTYYINRLNYIDIMNEYKNILSLNSHILQKRKY